MLDLLLFVALPLGVGILFLVVTRRTNRALLMEPEGPDQTERRGTDGGRWVKARLKQPAVLIADATRLAPDVVTLHATVRAKDSLVAPVSGRAACAYAIRITALNEQNQRVALVPTLCRIADFAVEDATGRALVQAENARLLLAAHDPPQDLGLPPEPVTQLLLEKGYCLNDYAAYYALQITEQVLLDGDEVVVSGPTTLAVDPSQPADGYRAAPTVLQLSSSSDAPLLIANHTPAEVGRAAAQAPYLPVARAAVQVG